MFIVETNIETALSECPIVREWIDVIKTYILKNEDYEDSKIQIYYSYGFFVGKSKNTESEFEKMINSALKMKFPERLEFEKSKVRVDATIRLGNLIFINRLPKSFIPSEIDEIVTEIIKIRMTIESEMDYVEEVAESIPDLTGKISFDIVRGAMDFNEKEFDMDEILDKISTTGMESLSDEEKKFLDSKSKDI